MTENIIQENFLQNITSELNLNLMDTKLLAIVLKSNSFKKLLQSYSQHDHELIEHFIKNKNLIPVLKQKN